MGDQGTAAAGSPLPPAEGAWKDVRFGDVSTKTRALWQLRTGARSPQAQPYCAEVERLLAIHDFPLRYASVHFLARAGSQSDVLVQSLCEMLTPTELVSMLSRTHPQNLATVDLLDQAYMKHVVAILGEPNFDDEIGENFRRQAAYHGLISLVRVAGHVRGRPEVDAALVHLLETNPVQAVKDEAIRSLARIGSSESRERLEYLAASSPVARSALASFGVDAPTVEDAERVPIRAGSREPSGKTAGKSGCLVLFALIATAVVAGVSGLWLVAALAGGMATHVG